MAMILSELLSYLFDGQPHPLVESMSTWLSASRRFTAFLKANDTKIRKKLRTARDSETVDDLRLELETAYLLLREKSFGLTYEPQHRSLGRSPDFEVSFTTSFRFMVEVTRLRPAQKKTPPDHPLNNEVVESLNPITSTSPSVDRFSDIVCSKLGQLLPQVANLVLVGMNSPHLEVAQLNELMLRIQKRAEDKDPTILNRYGFRDRADFFRHYQRLSAILVRAIPLQGSDPIIIWPNSQAKYLFPARVSTALFRSHTL